MRLTLSLSMMTLSRSAATQSLSRVRSCTSCPSLSHSCCQEKDEEEAVSGAEVGDGAVVGVVGAVGAGAGATAGTTIPGAATASEANEAITA